jgi:hypothetical protein
VLLIPVANFHQWKIATSIKGPAGKFATGVNYTGKKWKQYQTLK